MGRYVLRRLLWMPLVLLVLISLTFGLIRAAPGNPFSSERALAPEVERALEEKYGFNDPAPVQLGRYLVGLTRGDFGPSIKYKDRTVREILAGGIGKTMLLGALATVLALTIGLTAGIVGAVRQNSPFDYAAMSVATFGMSVPNFVTGPVLVLIFALSWKLLPVSGWASSMGISVVGVFAALFASRWPLRWLGVGVGAGWRAVVLWAALMAPLALVIGLFVENPVLILPSVTLALPFASRIARLMRAGMLEVIGQDFVRTARAKGLDESVVVLRHALRGGILPVVSYLGPAVAGILTGSLVVERIFLIPGIGQEFVEAALSRDYFLVLGVVVLDGTLLIAFNLIVDIVYGFLDPRIRYD